MSISSTPEGLLFARSHEWLRQLPDNVVEIGISDHAQQTLGDLVFVELPELGRILKAGEACAVVESVKAASDVYAPIGGTVIAANTQLGQSPELVNHDPYGEGWIVRVKRHGSEPIEGLLSASDYQALAAKG